MSFHDAFVPLWAPQHQGSTLLRALDRIFDWIAAAEERPVTNKEAQFSDVVRRAVNTGDFTDMECDICKEPITQDSPKNYWWKEEHMAVETFCSHKFHGSCLWTWIRDPDKRNCPYCRRTFYFRTNWPWDVPIYRYCGMSTQRNEPRLEHEQFLFRLAFMNELEIHPSELLYHLLEIHLQLRNWDNLAMYPNAFRQCQTRARKFISKTKAALNIPNDFIPASLGELLAEELRGCNAAALRQAADLLNKLNAVVSHKNFEAYVQRFVESEDDLVMILGSGQLGTDISSHMGSFIQHQNWNSPRYHIVARSPKVEYGPFDRDEAYAKITKLLRQDRFFPSTRKRKNRKAFRRLELHMQNPEKLADISSRQPSRLSVFDWLKAMCGRGRQPESAPPNFWSIFEGVPAFLSDKSYSGGAQKR